MMVRYRPFIVAFLLPVLIILAVPNSARAIYQLPFPLPPQDSIYWNQKTQLALRNGDLPNALIAFEHYIDSLTSRDLRDKMTFNWLLNLVRRDPRQTEKPTLADIRDLVSKRKAELNPEEDRDRIWRYNYLLAQIAVLDGRTDEAVTLMLQAIEGYPDTRYADPGRESLLPDMYNIASRWQAPDNINKAQDFISQSFATDPRFNYIELTFWKQYFLQVGNPAAYIRFLERLLSDYQKKMEAHPEFQDELKHYHYQLQWIVNNERQELQKEEWNKGRINRLPVSAPLGG